MRALVTGGDGHLGQALVALLLARGHTVRATVRSLADAAKTAPLRALGPVELFEADVRAIGRIDARVKPPLFVLPRIAAPMLSGADAFFHAVIGTPRIATPELIASSVGDRLFHFSAERAKRELGWAPRIPFEQSLRETLVHARGLAAR